MATTQRSPAQVERRRFTTDEYERLAEAGILGEDERIELIGGGILRVAAMGKRHARCVRALTQLLVPRLQGVAVVSVQLPLAIPESDEPEPDIAVLRPRGDSYAEHPTPADVLLLIEISDTTLAYDRGVKLPVYARVGIPEVRILDLVSQVVERYSDPAGGAYRSVERFRPGQHLASVSIPSLVVDVDTVLG